MPVSSFLHESPDLGRYERHERPPDSALAGVIVRLCGFEHHGARIARRREVAQDLVTIIVLLGPRLAVGGAHAPAVSLGSFVAPLHDSWAVTEESGELCGMQLDLTPLGARRLLGMPMGELSDQLVVPLDAVIGREAATLEEVLAGAAGWDARLDLLQNFVAQRLRRTSLPPPDVAWAWERLSATGGRLPIAQLARELGCSRRHLTVRFRDQIGPTPKTAARLLRFQRAVRALEHDDGRRFAEIAADCGFCDQPHLNREFRDLAGATPGEFVARRLPDGLGLAA